MAHETILEKRLGCFDATMIVVGSMIGSGIFLAPSIMATWIQTPGIFIGLWIFAGVFTIFGALAYAELAAMYPHAGGQYVFVGKAFGPFWAFLFGWTLSLVIQTGFNAAVAIAFAKYLGVFLPVLGEETKLVTFFGLSISSAQLVACLVIGLLTWVNIKGVRQGAIVQNFFTVMKILGIGVLIVGGIVWMKGSSSNFSPVLQPVLGPNAIGIGFLAALAVPLSKALFAYDAWGTVTYVAEEVKDPERSLPKALFWGCVLTMIIYALTNVAYMANMSLAEIAVVPENRIAQAVSINLFGPIGNSFVVIAILISTFGCVNGMILGGARVCFAMARDRLFFRSCSKLHNKNKTPQNALIFQGIWSCLLALTGSYNALLTYTTFASVLFGALTVAGVYKLRIKKPEVPRPYRCWGYPITPAIYLIIAVTFLSYVIQGDPTSAGIGLLIVVSGIPFYFFFKKREVS